MVDPHFFSATSRHHPHQAGVLSLRLNPLQVIVEQVLLVGREELSQIPTSAIRRVIVEGIGRSRVDGEDGAGQVVRADETETVLNELAIPSFAFAERARRLLPCRSDALES